MGNKICKFCNWEIKKSNAVIIVKDKITSEFSFIHKFCAYNYLVSLEQLKPAEQQKRIWSGDSLKNFTPNYEKSDKTITEDELASLKKMYRKINFQTHPNIVKILTRNAIWKGVGRKYIWNIRNLTQLSNLWGKNPEKFDSPFDKQFIPSTINQFKSRGYLSNKQWERIQSLICQYLDCGEYARLQRSCSAPDLLKELPLVERLRYEQKKQSFIKWYNEKYNIIENETE
jgi:hypothetical protein